jgi:hypothetical protein
MSEDKSTGNDLGVVTGGTKTKPKKLWWIVICAAVVIVLALAGAGMWWWSTQHSATSDKDGSSSDQPTLATVCDNSVIQSAGRPIADNDIASLQSIAESILQKKNYRGDVNCNYILMRYYLMIGDVSNAQKTMNDVSFTYGSSGGYSTMFDPPAMSPAALRDTLAVLIANKEEQQKQMNESDKLDQ